MAAEKLHGNRRWANPEEWEKAVPEELPKPVYWPFFLAMGIAFIFWGLLTTWIMLAGGCCITIIALAGWIKILYHERE